MYPMVPLCPFMSTAHDPAACVENCPLNLNGKCSIRVIAENLRLSKLNPEQSSDPTSDTRE